MSNYIDSLFIKFKAQQDAYDYIEGARAASAGIKLEGEHSESYINGYNTWKEIYKSQAEDDNVRMIAKFFNDLADKYGKDEVKRMIANFNIRK